MKKITRTISILLSALILTSVVTIAPFSVSAAETEIAVSTEQMEENSDRQPEDFTDQSSVETTVKYDESEAITVSTDEEKTTFPNVQQPNKNIEPVGASATTEDGFTYSTSGSNATITKYSGFAEELVIPDKIDGYSVTAIGDYAFSGCTSLKNLVLPESLKSLGYNFIENTSISSITIPKNVTSSSYQYYSEGPNGALANCRTLETVIFEKGMTKIPAYICASAVYTSNISNITIPNSVTNIGTYAFYKCAKLSSTLELPVTSVSSYAFSGCSTIQEISFGYNSYANNISIEERAFSGCTSLESVALSENIGSIGDYAFSGCTSLKNLVLPESLKSLGYNFIENTSISSITIPKNVTSSSYQYYSEGPNGALANCRTLETVIFEKGMTKIPAYICASAVYTSNISNITIPNSVTNIGTYAFYKCAKLSSTLELPVTSVSSYAFSGCSTIQEISFGYNSYANNISIEERAFSGCTSLESVALSENIGSIGDYAFSGCTSLKNLVLPESLKSLGYNFIENTSISGITIPKNVTSSSYQYYSEGPNGALANCRTLETVIFEKGMTKIPAYICASAVYTSNISNITIPNSVTNIGTYAFYKCAKLSSTLELPVTSVSSYAFSGCSTIQEISFGYNSYANNISIEERAFSGCTSLESVALSENIGSIGDYAFSGCTSLKNLVLPESLKSLGYNFIENTSISSITIPKNVTSSSYQYYSEGPNGALANCRTLETVIFEKGMTKIPAYICASAVYTSNISNITIPNSVTNIGTYAFYKCAKLSSTLELPVTSVSSYAFSGCSTIQEISFGYNSYANNISIEERAFSGCTSLESVALSENIGSMGDYAFSGCTSLKNLVLPESLKSLGYNFIENTSISSITIPKNVTSSSYQYYSEGPNGALANCRTLETVIFEKGMTKIPAYICASAVYTSNISNITIPNSVTNIGTYAFYKCAKLSSTLELPVTSVSSYAFSGCSTIQEISFGYNSYANNISIEERAFSGCTSLESVALSENIGSIGDYAFSGCTSLKNLVLPESLKSLGYNFIENTSISSITIPKNVTSSSYQYYSEGPNGALANCRTLETVIFEKGMTKIPAYICASAVYTSNISNITIPNSVTNIGNYAFYNCKKLGTIRLPALLKYLDSTVFQNSAVKNVLISKEDSPVALTLIDNEIPYTADQTGIKDSTEKNLNRTNTYYRTTASSVSAAGVLTMSIKYDFKSNVKNSVSNLSVKIKLPVAVVAVNGSAYVDGKSANFTVEDGGYMYIPVQNTSGTIRFSVQPNDTTYLLSYAQMEYRLNGTKYTETIGIVNMATQLLTICVPNETAERNIHVTGVASPKANVSLYLDDELVTSCTASAVGNYSADILLNNPTQDSVYKIEAKSKNSSGKNISALDYVKFNRESIVLTRFNMYFRNVEYDLIQLNGTSPVISWAGGNTYSFIIDFNNNQKLEVVKVVSTKGNEVRTIKAVYDSKNDYYVASGFYGYVPGTISVQYREKADLSNMSISNAEEEDTYTINDSSTVNGYLAKLTPNGDTQDLHYFEEYEENVTFENNSNMSLYSENGNVYYVSNECEWYFRNNGIFLGKEYYLQNADGTYNVYRCGVGMFGKNSVTNSKGSEPVGASSNNRITNKVQKVAVNIADKQVQKAFEDCGLGDYYGNTKLILDILNTNVYDAKTEDAISVALNNLLDNIDSTQLSASDQHKLTEAKTYLQLYTTTNTSANVNQYINKYIDQSFSISDEVFIPGSKTLNKQFRKEMKTRMKDCVDSMSNAEKKVSNQYLSKTISILTDKGWFSDSLLEKTVNQAMDNYDKASVNFTARHSIDPSGFVYEGILDNRVSGVKATIYYKETEGSEVVLWDATEYDQINPLYTDSDGNYAWDVPEGFWQIKFEKEGYETAYSEWLPVPPEQFDVNIGLVSSYAPTVDLFNAYNNEIQISFNQYVDASTVNESNVIFTSDGNVVTGVFEAIDEQTSAANDDVKLAKTFNFITNDPLNTDVSCSISNVKNYADVAMESEYTKTIGVVKEITDITVDESITVSYNRESKITIKATPSDAAVGKKLLIKSGNSYVINVPESVVFDKNGIATITVNALLVGESTITYSVEGTTINGSFTVVSNANCVEEPQYQIGDTNLDGIVSINDVTEIQRHIAELELLTDEQLDLADTNGDGEINISDATHLQMYIAEYNGIVLGKS